jgi:hypothetical protein
MNMAMKEWRQDLLSETSWDVNQRNWKLQRIQSSATLWLDRYTDTGGHLCELPEVMDERPTLLYIVLDITSYRLRLLLVCRP